MASEPLPPNPEPERRPVGAGAPIVLALVVGVVGGAVLGEPTIGFLAGATVGVIVAVLLWKREQK